MLVNVGRTLVQGTDEILEELWSPFLETWRAVSQLPILETWRSPAATNLRDLESSLPATNLGEQ